MRRETGGQRPLPGGGGVPSQGTTPGSRSQRETGPGRSHWPILGTDRFPEETTVSKEAGEEGAACPVLVLPKPGLGWTRGCSEYVHRAVHP